MTNGALLDTDTAAAQPSRPPRTAAVGRCPLCGRAGSRLLFRVSDRLYGIPGEFGYQRCEACGTVRQDPRVIGEDLGLCYPSRYYTHLRPGDFEAAVAPRRSSANPMGVFARRLRHALGRMADASPLVRLQQIPSRLREATTRAIAGEPSRGPIGGVARVLAHIPFIREQVSAGFYYVSPDILPRTLSHLRALDVGCGSGYLMTTLTLAGWDVEGVEWDPIAAERARESTGRRVWDGDFRQASLPAASYHLVVLNHVLEHLDDPIEALRRVNELLAEGGRAVLIYPNPESMGARVFRSAWFAWDPPRHLVFPSARALRDAAKAARLTTRSVRTNGKDAALIFSHSRAHREGRPADELQPDIRIRDQILAGVERALVFLGVRIGEELVVVLDKPQDRPSGVQTST